MEPIVENANVFENNSTLDTTAVIIDAQQLQLSSVKEAIKCVYDSRYGEIFRFPVDPDRDNVPDYFEIIKSPIDLTTILDKLEKNSYSDLNECIVDFRLMISNCFTYNPEGSLAHSHAKEVDKIFNKKISKYNLNISSPSKRHSSTSSPNRDEVKKDSNRSKQAKIKKVSRPASEKLISTPSGTKENNRSLLKRYVKETSNFLEGEKLSGISDAMNYCHLAINELFNKKHNEYSFPFLNPVDPLALNIPDYYDVIKCPMDLGTVRNKLKSNCYAHPQHFIRDVRLVFSNCYRYNGQNTDVIGMAFKLHKVFENFLAICHKDIFTDLFVNQETVDEQPNISYSRTTRRSQHVEFRQILDFMQTIDRRTQQISDDMVKIKNDKSSKLIPTTDVAQGNNKKCQVSRNLLHNSTQFKAAHSLKNLIHPRGEPDKVDDADPMTYDEKLSLSSQIMCLPEPRIKEILGIINQKEPWSRKIAQGKNKDSVEIDLECLQPTTLRSLENFVHQLNRKKTESSYRKKCTAEERSSREQDLRKRLENMNSQLSGKIPIPLGSKNTNKSDLIDKAQQEMPSRLSDSSSSSNISDDDFAQRYSLSKSTNSNPPSTNNTCKEISQNTTRNTSCSTEARTINYTKQPTSIPRSLISTSSIKAITTAATCSTIHNTINMQLPSTASLKSTINNSSVGISTSTLTAPSSINQNSFLAKLGITDSNSPSQNTIISQKNTNHPSQSEIDQLRDDERKKRMSHVGKIDIHAQAEIMKTFEDKI